MGLKVQTGTEGIYQDEESQTCYPRLPAETVPGLQLHIRSNGTIINNLDPPLNRRDL